MLGLSRVCPLYLVGCSYKQGTQSSSFTEGEKGAPSLASSSASHLFRATNRDMGTNGWIPTLHYKYTATGCQQDALLQIKEARLYKWLCIRQSTRELYEVVMAGAPIASRKHAIY